MKKKPHLLESFFPTVTPSNWAALDRQIKKEALRVKASPKFARKALQKSKCDNL